VKRVNLVVTAPKVILVQVELVEIKATKERPVTVVSRVSRDPTAPWAPPEARELLAPRALPEQAGRLAPRALRALQARRALPAVQGLEERSARRELGVLRARRAARERRDRPVIQEARELQGRPAWMDRRVLQGHRVRQVLPGLKDRLERPEHRLETPALQVHRVQLACRATQVTPGHRAVPDLPGLPGNRASPGLQARLE